MLNDLLKASAQRKYCSISCFVLWYLYSMSGITNAHSEAEPGLWTSFFFSFFWQSRKIIILKRYSLKSQWDYIAASEDWVIKEGLGWVFKELITAFWCWKRILIISNSLSASQDFTQLEGGLSASLSHGAWPEERSPDWFLGDSVASNCQRKRASRVEILARKKPQKSEGLQMVAKFH